jgi:hypothetical protein
MLIYRKFELAKPLYFVKGLSLAKLREGGEGRI